MTKTVLLFASPLFLVACGRAVATSSVTQSQLAPPDALQCVMQEFETLGFQRTMYDKDELRTSARKVNPKITFSSTQFRKAWDRLEVDVQAGAGGTNINVAGRTEAEYFGQNGTTYTPVQPSDQVQQAARTIQAKCGGSGPSLREPTQSSQQPYTRQ